MTRGRLSERDRIQIREVTDKVLRHVESLDSIRDRTTLLQEELTAEMSERIASNSHRLTAIGDGWRMFALAAARMVKGRDALDPPALAQRLRAQADAEEGFFRDLRQAVA